MTLLLPSTFKQREWRQPSQRATLHGIENRTYFRIQARAQDGALYWSGWFEDYDNADIFLWSLARHQMPNSIARLPQVGRGPHTGWASAFYGPARHEGEWQPEFADLPLVYQFATVEFVTVTGVSTWTSPSTWNNADNKIEAIGGGGGGGVAIGATLLVGRGGGGGAYVSISNHAISAPGTDTRFVVVGAGAGKRSQTTSGDNNGNAGSNTVLRLVVGGADIILCDAGGGGPANVTGGTSTNLIGGDAAVCTGTVKRSGGNSGTNPAMSGNGATGGGGAAGITGNGNAGVNVAAAGGATNGGAGGTTGGGTAGVGSTGTGARVGGNGGDGTAFDATHGAGGGGGAARSTNAGLVDGGPAGLYGGGGGGAVTTATSGTQESGAGGQGIFVFTHTPAAFSAALGMASIRRNVIITKR